MNKLWIRLTLAFGLVTVVGVLVVALLANRQVSADFRGFIAQSQVQDSALMARLTDYYAVHGGWNGVETVLRDDAATGGPHTPGQMMGRGGPAIVLTDSSGRVVYDDSGGMATHEPPDLAGAAPVVWQNQIVGYVVVRAPIDGTMPMAAQHYLSQVNLALRQAGLIAGGLGVLLGVAIARGVAAPLGRLAGAARRIAMGELEQRVPVAGTAEVADVARAFNEMAAGLQQAEHLRRNMVADIAHELRTPLTVIQGNLRAILDDVYPLDKGEIATIYDETVMLSRLVGDLRELAQAEAGQLTLDIQPTVVAPFVAGVVALFAEPAAAQGIALAVEVSDDLPLMLADPDRVRQVLHNLLANALRYTPAGGRVTLRVSVDRSNPRTIARAQLMFEVIDGGSGIADADLPYVFERFWRADRTRSREHGGSGLGLAIARQLAEAQGGQIGVESVVGQGSRFWLTLPVAPANAIASTS